MAGMRVLRPGFRGHFFLPRSWLRWAVAVCCRMSCVPWSCFSVGAGLRVGIISSSGPLEGGISSYPGSEFLLLLILPATSLLEQLASLSSSAKGRKELSCLFPWRTLSHLSTFLSQAWFSLLSRSYNHLNSPKGSLEARASCSLTACVDGPFWLCSFWLSSAKWLQDLGWTSLPFLPAALMS